MNNKKTQVISIVGAGGKTSLLYTLAEMFLRGDGDLRLFGLEPTGGMPDNPPIFYLTNRRGCVTFFLS